MSGEVTEVEPPVPDSDEPIAEPTADVAEAGLTARMAAGVAVVTGPFLIPWHAVGRAADSVLDPIHRATKPVWDWWERSEALRLRVPVVLTGIMCVWYFAAFEYLVWIRHSRFGTFDYDLGMYDQGIWQLSHGRGFMTVRGMHVFGHHANIGYLVFLPFYWLGLGGPQFLDIVNTAAVVLVALPIFLLAYRHLQSAWAGFFLVFAYLFHFSPQWKIQETFHPESIAAPLIVGAFYFASVGKWRWYWVCIGAALMWKEDVALATAVLGIAVALMFRRPRIGLITVAVSLAWFLVATKLIMGYFAPDGAVFDSLFGPLGTSATDLVRNAAVHPSRMWTTVQCHGFWDGKLATLRTPVEGVLCPDPASLALPDPPPRGFASLMQPYGYLPVFNPQLVAIGVPQQTVNYSTTADFTWDLRWHYAMFPYIAVLLGAVWAAVHRRRRLVAWAFIVVMVVGVVVTSQRGVGPWTDNHDSGWWPLTESPEMADYKEAMRGIEDDDRVSASYFLVPHLSHREYVYTFPNPWRLSNYGAGGTTAKAPNPNTIDDVVVDRARLNDEDRAMFDVIQASGQFSVPYRMTRNKVTGGTGVAECPDSVLPVQCSDVVRLHRRTTGPPITDLPVVPTTTTSPTVN